MAPKKREVIEITPMGSSSEEEEKSSGEEESESSAQSDSDKEPLKKQPVVSVSAVTPTAKLPADDGEAKKKQVIEMGSSSEEEEESSGEEESESSAQSDSDKEPLKKQPVVSVSAVTPTAKLPVKEADDGEAKRKLKTSKTEVRKISGDESMKTPTSEEEEGSSGEEESESESDEEPLKKEPVSAVTVPERSTAKRPLKEVDDGEAKKKLKTSTPEVKMFQRLFSEADEIALLQGFLDFTCTKGNPSEVSDAFCIYVKKFIDFDATKIQIQTKIQRLKKRFTNTVEKKAVEKGKSEDDIVFAKDLNRKIFELSRKIWGNNGVLASKSKKKLGETGMLEKSEINVVNTRPSIAREIASFYKSENVCGLDESTIVAYWEQVADEAKKKVMEEKWKKLKAMQVELCLQKTSLVDEIAKMIFKAN